MIITICRLTFYTLLLHNIIISKCNVNGMVQKGTIMDSRIIGGDVAFAGQFPFMAAIYKTTVEGIYFYGGALISNQWILTSGTCVDKASVFTIYLGRTSLKADEPDSLKLSTDNYVLHPGFDSNTLENDVGLIKLRMPITFNMYIRPIDYLPTYELLPGTPVTALGWGQISDDSPGVVDDLRYVFLTPISNEECKLTYGNQITDTMVCVAGRYNEGCCLGDNGTPLVRFRNGPVTIHMGIASFISRNGCDNPDPSGYTRTFSYVGWIKNTTGIP